MNLQDYSNLVSNFVYSGINLIWHCFDIKNNSSIKGMDNLPLPLINDHGLWKGINPTSGNQVRPY